jgi:periplasmic divalent cation tolerance protein
MNEFVLVLVTTSSMDEAQEIAMKLINSGLAPCVNILSSCKSIYQWKGEVRTDDEVLMVIKSKSELFDQLQALVETAHSYDVPEILAVDLARISGKYEGYLRGFLSEN